MNSFPPPCFLLVLILVGVSGHGHDHGHDYEHEHAVEFDEDEGFDDYEHVDLAKREAEKGTAEAPGDHAEEEDPDAAIEGDKDNGPEADSKKGSKEKADGRCECPCRGLRRPKSSRRRSGKERGHENGRYAWWAKPQDRS